MNKAQRKPVTIETRLGEPADERPSQEQQERYRKVVSLLRQWKADDQGEDDNWPLVEEELRTIRLQIGRR
jgi:hypothetical protein